MKKGKFREIKCPETRTQMMASDSLSAQAVSGAAIQNWVGFLTGLMGTDI